jgi:hypothetical protein
MRNKNKPAENKLKRPNHQNNTKKLTENNIIYPTTKPYNTTPKLPEKTIPEIPNPLII